MQNAFAGLRADLAAILVAFAQSLHILAEAQGRLSQILQLLLILTLLPLGGFDRGGEMLRCRDLLFIGLRQRLNQGLSLAADKQTQGSDRAQGRPQGNQNASDHDVRDKHGASLTQLCLQRQQNRRYDRRGVNRLCLLPDLA